MKFYPLTVAAIYRETSDCVSVALNVPTELRAQFQFVAGQYLTFRTCLRGEEIRRSYSICSSPLDEELRVAIKKVPGGKFSTFANEQLVVGDSIDVLPPMGRFGNQIQTPQTRYYVAIAAGSGITPIMSIVKTALRQEPQSQVCLIYGNKNRSSIIFKEELEALKNRYMGRLSIHYILSREMADAEILRGRINQEKCRFFLQKLIPAQAVDHYFICGPEEMIHDVKAALTEAEVDPHHIHFELFGVQNTLRPETAVPELNGLHSKVKIRLDGVTFDLSVPYNGERILDAALRAGADLPFACKGGVCCTCRAKLMQGEVQMDVNYALEPDEVASGYVLTCQSHPRTEEVILDFDAK